MGLEIYRKLTAFDGYRRALTLFQFDGYVKEHGESKGGRNTIGGTHYDITKMSKKIRKAHEYGGGPNMDMEEMW